MEFIQFHPTYCTTRAKSFLIAAVRWGGGRLLLLSNTPDANGNRSCPPARPRAGLPRDGGPGAMISR
jgi:aspartate oxidase